MPHLVLTLLLAAAVAEWAREDGFAAALFDELELLYPDSNVRDGAPELELHTPRGVPAGVHVLLTGSTPADLVRLSASTDVSWYRLVDVPVEENTGLGSRTEQFEGETNPHVIRRAPFRVFEVLQPISEELVPNSSTVALRVEIDVPADAEPGRRDVVLRIEHGQQLRELTWSLVVHAPVVPPAGRDTLAYTNWFSPEIVAKEHGVEPWADAFWPVLRRYAELMARGRQNTFWIRWADMFRGGELPALDRERLERYVTTFREAGLWWIEGGPIARRPEGDWSKEWLELSLVGVPATGEEGRAAIGRMLGEVWDVVEANGWEDAWLQHLADEPTEVNAADYVKLSGIVRAAMPGVRIVEATMCLEVAGAVDVWCPQVQEFQKRRPFFEERRADGDGLWVYTCLRPGGPWLNRLLDQERLRQVWIGWAASRYALGGFLHWGLNHYKADPFAQSVVDHPAMPGTTNKLPAGDTHVVYPGSDGPWSGQRFEAHRLGLEDHVLLERLRARDAAAADEIVARVFRAFDDYAKDVGEYRAARRALLEALEDSER